MAAFPVTLTLGIVLIPVVADYADRDLAVRAVTNASARWLWGHMIAAGSFGLLLAALPAVLRGLGPSTTGRVRASLSLLLGLGAALHAAGLGADGVGPVSLVWSGGDPSRFFEGSSGIVPPLFITGSALLGVGQILMVIEARKRGLLGDGPGRMALGSAILFSVSEALPTGWGLYGVGASALLLYLVLARALCPGVRSRG